VYQGGLMVTSLTEVPIPRVYIWLTNIDTLTNADSNLSLPFSTELPMVNQNMNCQWEIRFSELPMVNQISPAIRLQLTNGQ